MYVITRIDNGMYLKSEPNVWTNDINEALQIETEYELEVTMVLQTVEVESEMLHKRHNNYTLVY